MVADMQTKSDSDVNRHTDTDTDEVESDPLKTIHISAVWRGRTGRTGGHSVSSMLLGIITQHHCTNYVNAGLLLLPLSVPLRQVGHFTYLMSSFPSYLGLLPCLGAGGG